MYFISHYPTGRRNPNLTFQAIINQYFQIFILPKEIIIDFESMNWVKKKKTQYTNGHGSSLAKNVFTRKMINYVAFHLHSISYIYRLRKLTNTRSQG